jgi:hypothetical protein
MFYTPEKYFLVQHMLCLTLYGKYGRITLIKSSNCAVRIMSGKQRYTILILCPFAKYYVPGQFRGSNKSWHSQNIPWNGPWIICSQKKINLPHFKIKGIHKKDMSMRRIFWGLCINWFLIYPLHYLSSHSDFGFGFTEIFVIKKQLPDSASQWVGVSPSQRVGVPATLRLGKSGSRCFPTWVSRRVGF